MSIRCLQGHALEGGPHEVMEVFDLSTVVRRHPDLPCARKRAVIVKAIAERAPPAARRFRGDVRQEPANTCRDVSTTATGR
jgi:hypothetical protein